MGIAALLASFLLCVSPSKEVENVELRLVEGDVSVLEGLDALVSVRKGQQLSPKAVRQTLLRLFETGRFADAAVFSVSSPEGLLLRFDLWAKRKLTRLIVMGNHRLSEVDVANVSGLKVGSDLTTEAIVLARERLKERYESLGYPHVQIWVSASVQPGGTEAIVELSEGEAQRIRGITFEGQFPFAENVLRQEMDLREGAVFNLEQVAQGEQRLRDFFIREGYWQIQLVRLKKEEGGLCFSIIPGPKWALHFSGNQRLSTGVLEEIVHFGGGVLTLNRWELERIQRRLADFYRFRGYPEVRIRHAQFFSEDKSHARLTFFIEEGRQLLVRQIVFRGNARLEDADLVRVVIEMMNAAAPAVGALDEVMVDSLMLQGSALKAGRLNYIPRAEQVFIEEVWPQTAAGMIQLYKERGFLNASVVLSKTQWDDEGIVVYFDIQEGPQFHLKKLSMEGFPEGKRHSKLMLGMVISDSNIEFERQRLLVELMDEGYWFVSIRAQLQKGEEGDAEVQFHATVGPQVHLGKVVFRGLEKTQFKTANSQVFLVEGQVFNPKALVALQRRLSALGTFRFVEVRLLEPDVQSPQKDVSVELKESPRFSGEFSIGYFMADGPRVVFDFAYPNIGGHALTLTGRLAVNYYAASASVLRDQVDTTDLSGFELLGGRWNFSLQNRSLLPSNIGFRVDLVAERIFRPSYHFMRVALGPGLDWTRQLNVSWLSGVWPELTFLLQWEAEYSEINKLFQGQGIQPLVRADVERLRFLEGTFALQSLRATTILDARDNPVFPRRGFFAQVSLDWVSDLYARDKKGSPIVVQFLKLSGNLSFYLPIQKNVLAFSLRGGKIFPLSRKSVSPPVKRFYLGGATSLRGFSEDGLLAADFRKTYQEEVRRCEGVISRVGCSEDARLFLQGERLYSEGGELFLLMKAEWRMPVFEKLELGLFAEAGNLWLLTPKFPLALRPVAGLGIRYGTPVGPLVLDFGFNLNRDKLLNESLWNIYFSIGVF